MKLEEGKNSWTTRGSEVKYETAWIKVTQHDVLNPKGQPAVYGVVSFKNTAVGVVPLDHENNTWLVGQWRYPLKQYSWEIPEGGSPKGEDTLETAKRELKEETGIIAKNYTELCRMHTSNSVSDEACVLYVARDLSFSESEPEDSEDLMVRKVPFQQAYEMVMNGEITDSLSMVSILKIKILMDKGEL
jgi:ADP-ribose pyrophosphatase